MPINVTSCDAHLHGGTHALGNAHALRHGDMSGPNRLADTEPALDADTAPDADAVDSHAVGGRNAHHVADDFALTRLSPGRYAGPCHHRLHERERVLLPGTTNHHDLGGVGNRDGLHDVRRLMDLAQPLSRDPAARDDLCLGNRIGRHDTACRHIRGHG